MTDHDQLDPAEALMREVGAQLRQVRLERGEALEDVAQNLRIKATYLFGIEQGDLSMMPGRTYALGFLRSYADYLGFDGNDLIVQIKSTVANLTDRTRLRMRTPLPESRLPKTPILVFSLVAIVAIYAGWTYLDRSGHLVFETVAEVPDGLRNLALDVFQEGDRGQRSPPGIEPRGVEPGGIEGSEIAAPAADPAPSATPTDGKLPTAAPPGGETPVAGEPPAVATRDLTAPSAVRDAPVAAPPQAPDARQPPAIAGPTAPSTAAPAPDAAPVEIARAEIAPLAALQPQAGPGGTGADGADDGAAPAPIPSAAATDDQRSARPAATETGAGPGRDASGEAEPDGMADGRDTATAAQVAALDEAATSSETAADIAGDRGEVYEVENTDARVVLRARGRSWIQISSLSGDYLRTRTLEPGDRFLVPNRADLELWTGNAGGLEVILDGAVLGPVGAEGAVVRDLPLDPWSLRTRFARATGR